MDSTYAPQSPDLSSFLLAPDINKKQQQQQSTTTSYAPRSPIIPNFGGTTTTSTAASPLQPQNQYLNNQYNQQIYTQRGDLNQFEGYGGNQYMPPIPTLPPTHTFGFGTLGISSSTAAPQFYYPSQTIKSESDYQNNSPSPITSSLSKAPTISFNRIPSPFKLDSTNSIYPYNHQHSPSDLDLNLDLDLAHDHHKYIPDPVDMSTRQPRQPRINSLPNSHQTPNTFDASPSYPSNMSAYALAPQPSHSSAAPPTISKNPNPDNIEIRTKFPVARIKRIMQADEEVGKVAQVTPVAVSKALELFMISLVQGAARVAREKGGKRVTAGCLKRVVEGDEQFDFLSEIVGKVQDSVAVAREVKEKEKEKDKEVKEKEVKEGGEGSGSGNGSAAVVTAGRKRKVVPVVSRKKEEGSGSEMDVDVDVDVEVEETKKKGRGKGKGGRKKKVEDSI
ncbi:CBF/NF-Y family transcription factor [Sclerotinia borealis F-4128]|uniref:CBF/NF-Y family transcription factor n=1 Tax=Sclerotinia borealis (strain F-4128) TaxID=1432307 RepID=W9C9A5_SCLBF|nr:CBF/NF-Y family transcription factor [Sclerotinia borealis F-4128]